VLRGLWRELTRQNLGTQFLVKIMALHVVESFSCYTHSTEATRRRNAQRGLQFNSSFDPDLRTHPLSGNYFTGNSSVVHLYHQVDSATDATKWTIGFRFFGQADELDGDILCSAITTQANSVIIRLVIEPGGYIDVRTGSARSTVVGQAVSSPMRQRRFYYIEWEVDIHASAGTTKVWIDGVEVINETGLDTLNGTDDQAAIISTGIENLPQLTACCDHYVLDDGGSSFNARLGDVHVEVIRPDGDGNRNDFTRVGGGLNNYEAVDDAEEDGDTTYVHSNTVTDDELYTFAALTTPMDTVEVVKIRMSVRTEDGGYRTIRGRCRSNVTESTGESNDMHEAQYRHTQSFIELDPNGDIAWTDTAVNAAEFGFELDV